jgi:hypothetical protein
MSSAKRLPIGLAAPKKVRANDSLTMTTGVASSES